MLILLTSKRCKMRSIFSSYPPCMFLNVYTLSHSFVSLGSIRMSQVTSGDMISFVFHTEKFLTEKCADS